MTTAIANTETSVQHCTRRHRTGRLAKMMEISRQYGGGVILDMKAVLK